MSLADALRATTRIQLRAALESAAGDRDETARILDVSRRQVYQLLRENPDIAEEFPAARGRPKEKS